MVNSHARRVALRAGLGLAALVWMTNPWLPAAAEPPSEREKIDALIDRIAARTDVRFERNGMAYTSTEAARHLQMKREVAGAQIRTAREFIDRLGSASSLTGISYRVRFPNGESITSAEFLRTELASIETNRP